MHTIRNSSVKRYVQKPFGSNSHCQMHTKILVWNHLTPRSGVLTATVDGQRGSKTHLTCPSSLRVRAPYLGVESSRYLPQGTKTFWIDFDEGGKDSVGFLSDRFIIILHEFRVKRIAPKAKPTANQDVGRYGRPITCRCHCHHSSAASTSRRRIISNEGLQRSDESYHTVNNAAPRIS